MSLLPIDPCDPCDPINIFDSSARMTPLTLLPEKGLVDHPVSFRVSHFYPGKKVGFRLKDCLNSLLFWLNLLFFYSSDLVAVLLLLARPLFVESCVIDCRKWEQTSPKSLGAEISNTTISQSQVD